MPDLRFFLTVSRPRFWIYIFGPYLIGLVAGVESKYQLANLVYLLFAIYFLYPANLLIYGVNDIYDYETDKLNAKKVEYETLVTPERRYSLWLAIFVANFAFVGVFFFGSVPMIISGALFLFLSIFYSAPPIRAKTKPFLDSAFNVLYVMPGVFAYGLVTGEFPPAALIAAGGLWTAAMHAFSAIPDIGADREAGISTVATFLGDRGTLIFCLALYVASAALAFKYLGAFSVLIGSIYAAVTIAAMLVTGRERLFAIYRRFPVINAAVGFAIFWFVAIKKFF